MARMTLIQDHELEAAAEKAGGFVAAPWSLEENPKGMREFSAIRQYSVQHNKTISELTDEDYRMIGIER